MLRHQLKLVQAATSLKARVAPRRCITTSHVLKWEGDEPSLAVGEAGVVSKCQCHCCADAAPLLPHAIATPCVSCIRAHRAPIPAAMLCCTAS